MFADARQAEEYIKSEGVEFIDVRFCDLPGVIDRKSVV